MKVTVLGSQGMAGHMITAYLRSQGHEVTAVTRQDMDAEKPYQVEQFLACLKAEVVVNCIGLLVKDCIQRPDRAAMINAWFPQHLAQRLLHTKTRLIHLSTDCVFDGSAGPYREQDPHTELNAYGRSKSLGEVNNHKDITMRMSIIGPELRNGTGLLNWVLTNPAAELPGWDNAWWNGITTLQLAKCVERWMASPTVTGVYHVVNNDVSINKHDLLCRINGAYKLGKTVVATQAPKPVNKILLDTRLEMDWAIPDYREQLEQLRGFDPLPHVAPTAA
jgi:dTDP-4-dehydrorhamnose reductase